MRYLLFIFCLLGWAVQAQETDTSGTILPENKSLEFESYGLGEITYEKGKKIQEDPKFEDTVKVESEIDYSFVDKKEKSHYKVQTIKAPKLSMVEPLEKLYKGHMSLGINDFKTPPFFEFSVASMRNKRVNSGLMLSHISQDQPIKGYGDPRYTDSYVGLYGKKFNENWTWFGSADYNYQTFRLYGYDPSVYTPSSENANITGYSILNMNGGFKSRKQNQDELRMQVEVGYDQLFDYTSAVQEHSAYAQGVFKKQINVGEANVLFNADQLYSKRQLSEHNSILFTLAPKYTMQTEDYTLTGGVNINFLTNQERGFHIYPFLDGDYAMYKGVLHIYATLKGNYQRLSYLDYVQQNPFVTLQQSVSNVNNRVDLKGGLKGAINSAISFNVGGAYRWVNDFVLFANLGDVGTNAFHIIQDDEVVHRQAFGELVYEGKKGSAGAKGNYNIYDVYQQQPYHLPAVYIEGFGKYNLQDKIEVGTQVFYYGKQLALEAYDAELVPITKELKGIIDFNVDIKYNYSPRLGAFLKVNNILNTKHVRWDMYANYGLNVLFGVNYQF